MVSEECPCRLERVWLRQGRSSGSQPLEKVLRGKGCNRVTCLLVTVQSSHSKFTENPVGLNSAEELLRPWCTSDEAAQTGLPLTRTPPRPGGATAKESICASLLPPGRHCLVPSPTLMALQQPMAEGLR